MIAPIADHLWQSTLVAAIAALLTLALSNNRAHVRHWLWLAASVKFLVPFAALVALGQQFGWRSSTPVTLPVMTFFMETVGQPFAQPQLREVVAVSSRTASPGGPALPMLLLAIWAAGCTVMLLTWWVRWRRVAAIVRQAATVEQGRELSALRRLKQISGIRKPLAMVASNSSLEPGVFGILNPVLLWPVSISERLADAQIEAILAHELAHVRRRDNLAAAVHMVVQSVFWFHPLVWWIGARLVDERERACDEDVIRMGSEPQVYAESILRTCEFYVEAPLVCVAGVTGSDLKKRIEGIMRGHAGDALGAWRKSLLLTAGAAAIAGPVTVGILNAPPLRAQTQPVTLASPPPQDAAVESGPKFEVASIKPDKSNDGRMTIGIQPGGRFTASNVPLRMLVRIAYQLQPFQIVGGSDWMGLERFDITAKAEGDVPPSQPGKVGPMQLMLQALLADRFKLAVHQEQRELPIYNLVLARSDGRLGPELRRSTVDCQAAMAARGRDGAPPAGLPPPPRLGDRPTCGIQILPGRMMGGGFPLSQFAVTLSQSVQRVVVDQTGLTGNFDFELTFTPDQLPQGTPPPGAPALPPIDSNGPSIFTALQEQLGLKLDSQRGPVEVLVIDRAERPTEN